MRLNLLLLVSLIFGLLTSALTSAHSFIMGTIKFPKTLASVPMVRIYCGGRIIPCTADLVHKQLAFSIPRINNQFQFNMVFTPYVGFASKAGSSEETNQFDNTIEYLRAAHNDNKLFRLALIPKFQEHKGQGQIVYQWRVIEDKIVATDDKIPDEAIIICYDPSWVDILPGNNEFELPTIEVKHNVIDLCGSPSKFYEKSAQFLLAAINSDALHDASSNQAVKQVQNRIIIAAPVA